MDNVPDYSVSSPQGDSAAIFRAGFVTAMQLAITRVEHLLTEVQLVHAQLRAALADRQLEAGER